MTPDLIDFLKERMGAFPSPWDDKRLQFLVRPPTLKEVETIPPEYDGLLPYHKAGWYDQGGIGSCVGWSSSISMEITNYLLDNIDDDLSAGWIYERSRTWSGIPESGGDGSFVLGAMKALNHEGINLELDYPTDTVAPYEYGNQTPELMNKACNYALDSYWSVPVNTASMKAALYGITHPMPYKMADGSNGKVPLVVALPVYNSWFKNPNGIVEKPAPGDGLLGGHATIIRGWKNIGGKLYWINTNSWGRRVGDQGTFYLAEDYPIWEAWLIHNGPRNYQEPNVVNTCRFGNGAAKTMNFFPWLLGRTGRFFYETPGRSA